MTTTTDNRNDAVSGDAARRTEIRRLVRLANGALRAGQRDFARALLARLRPLRRSA